ncbi:MAG: hypothetical protein V1928_02715 [Parcubacteria group bacterium]
MIRIMVNVLGRTIEVSTHDEPHLDEIACIWEMKRYGTLTFISNYAMEGKLSIGIGGGPFDEHAADNIERKEGECAATLMAKALGVEDDPALEPILKFVCSRDLKGKSQPFDLDSLVKLMNARFPNDPEHVIEWAIAALEAKYQEQLAFFTSTKAAFEKAKIEDVEGPGGRKYRMVVAESDEAQLSKYARSNLGGNSAIIIQRQSSGNVQIYTNQKYNLTLYDVIQMLRFEEQKSKGKLITADWKMLSSEGKVAGAEEWYLHYSGQMILNGSLTVKNVPPTKLTLEQIVYIVRIGVNPQLFEHVSCQQNKTCDSRRQNPCPWYAWGMQRCRNIRYRQQIDRY